MGTTSLRQSLKGRFDACRATAAAEITKYIDRYGAFLRAVRILDPRQRATVTASMGTDPQAYEALLLEGESFDAAEWNAYLALDPVDASDRFGLISWRDAIEGPIPHLARVGRRELGRPQTTCDVERAVSSLTWVKQARQQNMLPKAHATATIMHFNGCLF